MYEYSTETTFPLLLSPAGPPQTENLYLRSQLYVPTSLPPI